MKRLALLVCMLLIDGDPLGAQSGDALTTDSAALSEKREILATFKGEPLTASDLEPDARTMEMTRKAYSEHDFNLWLEGARSRNLTGIIVGTLFEDYRKAEVIEPTPEEIDQFVEASERAERQSRREFRERHDQVEKRLEADDLSEDERSRLESERETLQRILASDAEQEKFGREHWGEAYEAQSRKSTERVARQMILAWKTNKSLFDRYGGRVIFQQAGPEPVDAYRRFLEERRDAGDFEIVDPELREAFWECFVNDRMHAFYEDEEGAEWMNTPWWVREEKVD